MVQKSLEFYLDKKIHLLGSCGTLMAGLARLALDKGLLVTGSDRNPCPPMSTLLPKYCQYSLSEKQYTQADCIILGNVFRFNDPIVEELRRKNIPLFSSMDFLNLLFPPQSELIAICGTHGKSTTSSLLAWILEVAQRSPSYLIGACLENFPYNARYREHSQYFILEADEYDISCFDKRSKMQALWPDHILMGTVEFDHADIFRDQEEVFKAFNYFLRRLPPQGSLITLGALPESFEAFEQQEIVQACELGIVYDLEQIFYHGQALSRQARLFGPNAKNLTLAIAMAKKLGVSDAIVKKALETFQGVTRRSHYFCLKGVDFWVDFAHHPGAIEAFLETFPRDKPLGVLVEKASRSMSQGAFDDRLFQLEKRFPYASFEYVQKGHLRKKRLESFQNDCVENNRVGIIMTNNPLSWSDIQCVFSMPSQEALPQQ